MVSQRERNRGEETGRKRHRVRYRGEETERRDGGEETEGRDIGEIHRRVEGGKETE